MKKFALAAAAVVFVLIAAVVLENRAQWNALYRTGDEMQNKIDRAHLIGKSPQEVIRFLDREKIQHSEYITREMRRKEAIPYDQNEPNGIGATVHIDVATFSWQEGPLNWDAFLSFQFDARDRLRNFEVSLRPTGF